MTTPGSSADITACVDRVAQAVGAVADGQLTDAQLQAGDAAIDAMRADTDAQKLSAAMLKAFLRLPFDDGNIGGALERYAAGDYTVSNDKCEQNGRAATSDTAIKMGGLESDAWSVAHVVTDALSHDPAYKDIAEQTGKQMAMLLYANEKMAVSSVRAFDVIEAECARQHIAPLKSIHLFEFAGNKKSTLANRKRGAAKLFGSFVEHQGAGWHAETGSEHFVTLEKPVGIPQRGSGVSYIITHDVFNEGGVKDRDLADHNARTLLSVFSNVLPDGGKLLVSTSFADGIDLTFERGLMGMAGFKVMHHEYANGKPHTGSYMLARDFSLRGEQPITRDELQQFSATRWSAAPKGGDRATEFKKRDGWSVC